MSDWDQLLQESEDLAFRVSGRDTRVDIACVAVDASVKLSHHPTCLRLQDAEGFPQVERDLLQVEELSQKLRTKASRLDQAEDGLAASRLLAQQGVNVRR